MVIISTIWLWYVYGLRPRDSWTGVRKFSQKLKSCAKELALLYNVSPSNFCATFRHWFLMSSIVSCNPLKLRIKKKCFLLHLLVRFYIELSINYYIISSVMHAFWLVLTYDLLEDRHIDDVIIKTLFNS